MHICLDETPEDREDITEVCRESRQLPIQVQYIPGEDVVVGRDSRRERSEVLVLSIRTSPRNALADNARLCQWFEASYASWRGLDPGGCYQCLEEPRDTVGESGGSAPATEPSEAAEATGLTRALE